MISIYKKLKKVVHWFLAISSRRLSAVFLAAYYFFRNPKKFYNALSEKSKKWALRGLILLLIILIAVPTSFWLTSKKVEAAWWNDSWQYRKPISITNASGGELTDFQTLALSAVNLSADITAGKIQSDLDDLRFTDVNGDVLPYWIEDATATTAVNAWVKMTTIPTGGATIYMYYGNPSATSAQNPNNIFPFFDDFNSFDANKWTATGGYSIASGAMTITTGAVYTNNTILATAQNYVYEYKSKWSGTNSSYAGLEIGDVQSTQGSNGGSNKVVYFITDNGNLNATSWAADGTSASYNIVSGTTEYTATADTYYIDGFSIDSSYVRYYHNRSQTNPYSGTWTSAPYLWLGYFSGQGAGTTDIRDLTVDWVLARKYASTAPAAAAPATEEKSTGPVAYWSFDDGQGIAAQDGTVNNNDGTLENMSATPDPASGWQTEDNCVAGKCLAFDGDNDYVNAGQGTNSTFNIGTVASFSVWVKPLVAEDSYIIRKVVGGGEDKALMWNSTGKFSFFLYSCFDGTHLYTDTVYAPGVWYHVEGVYDGENSKAYIYVNGKLDGTKNTDVCNVADSTGNLIIGRSQSGSSGDEFHGSIDEVKVYNYARSAAQIKMDYNVGMAGMSGASAGDGAAVAIGKKSNAWMKNGLLGYWKMDEAVGSWDADTTADDAIDSSGNGNTGSAYGDADSAASGKFGNGGTFDGTGDYVIAPDLGTGLMSAAQGSAVSAWVNYGGVSTGQWQPFINKGANNNGFWWIGINSDGNWWVIGLDQAGGGCSINSGITAAAGWHHFALNQDGSHRIFYMDGNPVGSKECGGGVSGSIYIGKTDSWPEYWGGEIDEVRIYNRALSPDEVKKLYEYAPGPVAHWKMDERTGQNVYDSSGNSNNATLGANSSPGSDDPAWANGKFGAGLQFDGTSDYVDTGAITDDISTGSITVSAWVKLAANHNSDSPVKAIFTLQDSPSTNDITFCFAGSGSTVCSGTAGALCFDAYDSGSNMACTSRTSWSANTWYHVVGMIDTTGGGQKVYVDGVQDGSNVNIGRGSSPSTHSHIGAEENSGIINSFSGSIDDVRVYNYARSQKQVLEDMIGTPEPGGIGGAAGHGAGATAAYWKFDEGYGDTAHNDGIGGSVLDGTLESGGSGDNSTETAMWDNGGKFGKAVEFDGSNDYVDSNYNGNLSQISISTWAKFNSIGNLGRIIEKNGSMVFYHNNGDNSLYFERTYSDTTGVWYTASNTLSTGQWYHIVLTYDDSSINNNPSIYINGKPITVSRSVQPQGTASTSGNNFIIGNRSAADRCLNGYLDEFKIYNYALTADEVKLDYNHGQSLQLGSAGMSSAGVPSNAASQEYCIPGDATSCAGPVGEWKFEEGSGQSAQDTSGNGNTGQLGSTGGVDSADPIYAIGKVGKALNFESNQYVNAGSASTLDNIQTSGSGLTVSMWVNVKRNTNQNELIDKGDANGNGFWFLMLDGSDPTPSLRFMKDCGTTGYGQDLDVNTDFYNLDYLNKWRHIVMTWDGTCSASGVKFYIDGVLRANASSSNGTGSTISDAANNLYIGGTYATNRSVIEDNVRIYDYVRTPAQVAWEYNRGKPVAEWRMNECQGDTVHDESGFGNNGTINLGASDQTAMGTCAANANTPWWNGRNGKYGASLNFDGGTDYVDMGNDPSIQLTTTGTISTWVKFTSATSYPVIIGNANWGTDRNGYLIFASWHKTGDLYLQLNDASGYIYVETTNGGYNDGNWHHVTGTFDGSYLNIYVDGVIAGTPVAQTRNAVSGVYNLTIGKNPAGNDYYWNGQIDDVKVFNYALTPVQVRNLYNNSSAINFGN